jgi:hypothetical protein
MNLPRFRASFGRSAYVLFGREFSSLESKLLFLLPFALSGVSAQEGNLGRAIAAVACRNTRDNGFLVHWLEISLTPSP